MESVEKDIIIVPCDFTPLSYQAIEHGAVMSKAMNQHLLLFHVASPDADISSIEKKFSFVVEECVEKYNVRPEFRIRRGTRPYSVIKDFAQEISPTFVVLKTGGVRGMKRYTGIRTIKILSGTVIPFLVIQGSPRYQIMQNIVFPINFLSQHEAKLRRVLFFSNYYPDATMHIITPSGQGTPKETNIDRNLKLMTKVLEDQNVKVNFITHDKKKNTAEVILEISKTLSADMIMIQMENAPTFHKFLFGLREEKLITNSDKIPVMCLNRLSDFRGLE